MSFINLDTIEICTACGGSGSCSTCRGAGCVTTSRIDPDDTNNDSDKCPDCLTAWSGICKPCKGKGVTS